jgi:hypothetical protein
MIATLAVVRPSSWNLPLFLHVLGAMALVGAMTSVTVLAWTGSLRPERAVLSKASLWTMLVLAVPSWLLMRLAAEWIYSKEDFSGKNDPNWIGVGFFVSDLGLLVLLVTTGFAFWWSRRGGIGWQGRVIGVLAPLYLALLALAWWVMAAKPAL